MTTRLYGILWRWHFLAGLIASPILLVLAITGALYVFQHELEHVTAPQHFAVPASDAAVSIDALAAALPPDCKPGSLIVEPDGTRSAEVWCADGPNRRVFLDPYRHSVLGSQVWEQSFFGFVLELHWELLLDDNGRLAVEWATSWAILLLLSGVYLWWPRGRRSGGAWWVRRGVGGRQWLRDLHAVAGAYVMPVLLVIAATGLFWTKLAGDDRWGKVSSDVIAETWRNPPRSTPAAGQPRIGYDAAIAAIGYDRRREDRTVNIRIDDDADAPYQILLYEADHSTPWRNELVWVDAYSGTTLARLGWSDRTLLGKVNDAGYAVHVGAVGGTAGKIIALLAALGLAALCITGPWIWWKRRPSGRLGIPPRPRRASWPLVVLLVGFGWLLPTVGWTLIVVAAVELTGWLGRRAYARWTI